MSDEEKLKLLKEKIAKLNKSLDAVSKLVGEIEKLHEEGTAKTECYVKASELVFWLQLYQDENFNFAGEIEDE